MQRQRIQSEAMRDLNALGTGARLQGVGVALGATLLEIKSPSVGAVVLGISGLGMHVLGYGFQRMARNLDAGLIRVRRQ